MAGGRPTDFKQEYVKQVYQLCLLGATDKDIADFFSVTEQTINNWKNDFPEFFESLREGKEIADMHIANKLYNRAEGAIINTQQAFKLKKKYTDENGNKIEDEVVEVVDLQQELPPDTTAMIFWLKNRKSTKWKDKILHGSDGDAIIIKHVSETDEAVLARYGITTKELK